MKTINEVMAYPWETREDTTMFEGGKNRTYLYSGNTNDNETNEEWRRRKLAERKAGER